MSESSQRQAAAAGVDATEIVFPFEEIFFSRTDPAGRIEFGNSVFQRVSIYSWDELIGAPHKIVRHPDTPRAVFWLLWDSLKRGEPIAAYVKNRAKDGRPYWVFAIATPITGGFLSVRIRPSSPLFEAVKGEYAPFAAVERGIAQPAESARVLLARLAELGFADYRTFMATAIAAELEARAAKIGRPRDEMIGWFRELMVAADQLVQQAGVISDTYVRSANVPFNFRVLAAQIGQEGAALGVISGNYSALSLEMKNILDGFVLSAREVCDSIKSGLFLHCAAQVQREALAAFRREQDGAERPALHEMALLDGQQRDYEERALSGLRDIASKVKGFQQTSSEMSRLAAGLEVTRIMGKVEGARHTADRSRLDELLGDLEAFQKTVAQALRAVERHNQLIELQMRRLLSVAQAA